MVYDTQDGMSRCGRCGQAHIGLGHLCDRCEHNSQKGRFCDGPPADIAANHLRQLARDLMTTALINSGHRVECSRLAGAIEQLADDVEAYDLDQRHDTANDHAPCESEGGA